MKRSIIFLLVGCAAISSGCATISEESCIAGSWEALGYEDGRDGSSRGKFTKIAETCAKYGIVADATQYRIGYSQGLPLYCSYDRGVRHGEDGSSLKQECREINAVPYLDGYDEGRIIYELRQAYNVLLDDYRDTCRAIEDVTLRLSAEGLEPKEKSRLIKKLRRLERQLVNDEHNIRYFEEDHGWPEQNLDALLD